jgi:hypothetical protein
LFVLTLVLDVVRRGLRARGRRSRRVAR